MSNKVLYQVGNRTTDGCHREQSEPEPSRHDAHNQGHDARYRRHRRMDDIRKGHHRQRHVRHIVKETAHKLVTYHPLYPARHPRDESHPRVADAAEKKKMDKIFTKLKKYTFIHIQGGKI